MKRKYYIDEETLSGKRQSQKMYIKKTEYEILSKNQISAQYEDSRMKPVLPTALDVFSDLPKYVYENEHAKMFLECLRAQIAHYNPIEIDGIVLSKLQVSEATEKLLIIEWIYNFFRFYYAFDKSDGDYRGVVMSDPDEDSFTNNVQKMKPEDYSAFAEADLAYVVMMAEGVTDGLSG